MPIVNLPAEHPYFTTGGSSREQKMEEFFEKGLPPKMAALVNLLGDKGPCIKDIRNMFGILTPSLSAFGDDLQGLAKGGG